MAIRRFSRRCLAGLLLGGALTAPWLLLDDERLSTASAEQVADLKEQLKFGLQARRPEEFAYIDRVVQMVQDGRLPIELVKSTFQWARRKKAYRTYPFPYFERALRIRAAEIGVTIEPLETFQTAP